MQKSFMRKRAEAISGSKGKKDGIQLIALEKHPHPRKGFLYYTGSYIHAKRGAHLSYANSMIERGISPKEKRTVNNP